MNHANEDGNSSAGNQAGSFSCWKGKKKIYKLNTLLILTYLGHTVIPRPTKFLTSKEFDYFFDSANEHFTGYMALT